MGFRRVYEDQRGLLACLEGQKEELKRTWKQQCSRMFRVRELPFIVLIIGVITWLTALLIDL